MSAQADSISIIRDSVLIEDSHLLKGAKFFTISSSEVQRAELAIRRRIHDDYIGAQELMMKPLFKYYRTYVGLQLKDSTRVAYVVGRCHEIPGWEKSMVLPKGGGNCYFFGAVDLSNAEVMKLSINAPL